MACQMAQSDSGIGDRQGQKKKKKQTDRDKVELEAGNILKPVKSDLHIKFPNKEFRKI